MHNKHEDRYEHHIKNRQNDGPKFSGTGCNSTVKQVIAGITWKDAILNLESDGSKRIRHAWEEGKHKGRQVDESSSNAYANDEIEMLAHEIFVSVVDDFADVKCDEEGKEVGDLSGQKGTL